MNAGCESRVGLILCATYTLENTVLDVTSIKIISRGIGMVNQQNKCNKKLPIYSAIVCIPVPTYIIYVCDSMTSFGDIWMGILTTTALARQFHGALFCCFTILIDTVLAPKRQKYALFQSLAFFSVILHIPK